jgi:hypothetical protein
MLAVKLKISSRKMFGGTEEGRENSLTLKMQPAGRNMKQGSQNTM